MRVLGVDPGYDRLGLAILEGERGKEKVLFSSCVETDRKESFDARLLTIGLAIRATLSTWHPDLIALETLYMSKNQKTALPVASARGVVLFVSAEAQIKVVEYSPQAVKIATTGYGNSTKDQVMKMVTRLVSVPNLRAKDDEFDAIAVALTALASGGRGR